jgi:HK97 family phage major capsid protein
MDEKEIKELMDGISKKNSEAIRDAVEEAAKGLMKTSEFEQLMKNYGLEKETVKKLLDAVEKQGIEITQLREGENKSDKQKTLHEVLQPHAEALKRVHDTGRGSVRFALKADVTRSSIANSTLAMRETEIGQLPTLQPQLMNLFSRGTVSPNNNGVIRYFERTSVTNAAAPVSEASVKPESAFTWTEKFARIETIAHWVPVTKQSLTDIDLMASEIDDLLRLYLSLKVDQQLYDGSGTSPELRGAYTAAPTFVGTPYQTTAPTIYDLIVTVASDINKNKDSLYSANIALMNPDDVLKYKLAKGSDNHYLLPPFVGGDGNLIAGIQVIPTARVTANTMLVGDFRFGRVFQDGDVIIEAGLIDNQFVKNMVTILAEVKLCLRIKDVNVDAFRKVTNITNALNDIA